MGWQKGHPQKPFPSKPRSTSHIYVSWCPANPCAVYRSTIKKNMLSFLRLHLSIYNYLLNKIKIINQVRNKRSRSMCRRKKCSLSQKNLNIIYKNIQNLFKNNPEVKIFQTTTQWMDFRKYVPQKRCRKGSIDHYVSRILLHSILIWGLPSSIL